jgi:PAS domain S-box-containing protein
MDVHNKTFASILNTLTDAFMIMDAGGRIAQFNTIAVQITGYASFETKGMTYKDIFKTAPYDADYPFNGKDISQKVNYKRTLELTRKDGIKVPVECTRSILMDSDGHMTGMVEAFKDISRTKGLEDNFIYSESKYRRLFENTKDMIFIISKQGRIIEINQAMVDLLDYKDKKEVYLLANIEHIFIDPIHWQVCKKHINLNGFVQDFEVGFKKKDGTRLHGCLSVSIFRDDNGNIIGYEGIAKDITARMDSFRRLYKHHQELLLLNTVALSINSSQDLNEMLAIALHKAMALLNFSIGTIFLINHVKGTFELQTRK